MIAVLIAPDVTLAVVCSPEYLAGTERPTEPAGLTKHRCLNLRVPTYGGLLAWELERAGQKVSVRVEGQAIFNSSTHVLQGALDGLGIAYVPLDLARPHIAAGRLVTLLDEWWLKFPLYLYYPSRRQSSPAFVAVVDALRHGT
jgi:DNA-binding transcriptional LysR family regulator